MKSFAIGHSEGGAYVARATTKAGQELHCVSDSIEGAIGMLAEHCHA